MSYRPLRLALVLAVAAGALAACASKHGEGDEMGALTPTQQYHLETENHPDEIRIAAHRGGLSPAQTDAINTLADRWRDSGGGHMVLQLPRGGADPVAVQDTARAAEGLLVSLGVPSGQLERVGYDPDKTAGAAPAPLVVGFLAFHAVVPGCGREWSNLTATFHNRPSSNFGCAVTANMAAQIANPADISNPPELQDADAQRRGVILDKYRKGETTSSNKDSQAAGTMSTTGAGGGGG